MAHDYCESRTAREIPFDHPLRHSKTKHGTEKRNQPIKKWGKEHMVRRRNIIGRRSFSLAGFVALIASTVLIPLGSPWAAASASPHQAGPTAFTATGMDNIWGAGLTAAPDPGGNGGGVVPADVTLPAGSTAVSFSGVTGTVTFAPTNSNGPDGSRIGLTTEISPYGGISGLMDQRRYFYLVGVFLDGGQPTSPPATLNFAHDHSFKSLAPLLGQVFFVGDGRTHTGRGKTQIFDVPSGATDLYLGFADAPDAHGPCGAYSDNSGSVSGDVTFVS